jgi:predicted DNA-binding transcriptional regulator AlpA
MTNPAPNTAGLCAPGRGAVGWCREQVDSWVHSRVKNTLWMCPPLPRYPTIIRKRELIERTGLSHVTLWKMEKRGLFPPRFKLTGPVVIDDAAE